MNIFLTWSKAIPVNQFSEKFVQGMLNRMQVGFRRYGDLHKSEIKDNSKRITAALSRYKKTHNTEFLIDVANYAMIEFMKPSDPKAFFECSDSDPTPSVVAYFRQKGKGT